MKMDERGSRVTRWLVISLSLVLLRSCHALTPPNCTVITDTTCAGDVIGVAVSGSSNDQVLATLNSRFCGCTYITGSLSIQLTPGSSSLTEDSFNALYYLKEISGSLQFKDIPQVASITLLNLRIIRGQSTFTSANGPVALVVESSYIGSLNLPNLTEISNGGAAFVSTNGMCGFLNVNWNDILNNEQLDYSMSGCNAPSNSCPPSCLSRHCWSSPYCQTLTRTVCPQGCGRCFQPPGGGPYQCCSSLCAAGCSGTTSSQCYACSTLLNNGTCVTQCPPAQVYDPTLFMLVNNPNYRLASGGLCVQKCTGNLLEYAGTCVTSCPPSYTSNNGNKCVACNGVCPRVCAGVNTNVGLQPQDYGQFNSCTIVNGSLLISDSSVVSATSLEILSTIQEIQGYLRINNLRTLTSFPYLRNLKKIGFPGSALNVSISGSMCPGSYQLYSLYIVTTYLQSIDLSSLQQIQYGGYVLGNNPYLCYVGNFSHYLANSGSAVCLSSSSPYQQLNTSACIAAGYVCHPQCSSTFSCWGPNDTQCDGCRNYVYNGRCVANCSVIVQSPGSSGILQSGSSGVCEDCDPQCLGGCVGGTDAYHCTSCRSYVLPTQTGQLCVASCPQGTYANGTMCIPCYKGCTMGCAGPLPYVNLTNGCLGCSYVQLDQQGHQVSCYSSSCPQGTYPSSSSSSNGLPSGSTLQLVLQGITTLCLPCDGLCASCTGPGNTSCTTCRYARRYALCVSGCDNTTEYQDSAMNCLPCAQGCIGCTGPSISQCVVCASESCSSTGLQSAGITGIVFGGLIAMCLAVGVVITLFIVYKRYVHKISKSKNLFSTFYGDGHEMMTLQPPKMPPNATRLIITPVTSLELGAELGKGAFGTVYKGYWTPEGDSNRYEVAIKVLNDGTATSEAQTELLQEGVVMATMDHINVVRLYSVCMGKQMMLISQFVKLGSLLSFLKKNQATLDAYTMLNFSKQIADGMAYLEEKRMVHRDLAARNVLVHTPQQVKITDFGLTRIIDVGEKHYKATGGKVPLRWLAPECVRRQEYTHKSDVWSFGVTIWEILTFGARPYQDKESRQIIPLLEAGHRLEQPATCTIDLYLLLLQCWLLDPNSRPDFMVLPERLAAMLEDPLRYILTTHDGKVSNYQALPSNTTTTMSASNYENAFNIPDPGFDPYMGTSRESTTTGGYRNALNGETVSLGYSKAGEAMSQSAFSTPSKGSTGPMDVTLRNKALSYEEPLSSALDDPRYVSLPKSPPNYSMLMDMYVDKDAQELKGGVGEYTLMSAEGTGPVEDGDQYLPMKDGDQYLPMKDGDQYLPMKDGDQYLPMNIGRLPSVSGSHRPEVEQYTYVDLTKPRSASAAVQPAGTRRPASTSSAPKTPLKTMPSVTPSATDVYVEQVPVVNDYEVPLKNNTDEYELPTNALEVLQSHQTHANPQQPSQTLKATASAIKGTPL